MQLSKAQLEASNAIDGQYIAVSCPGSGKTTCIVQRAINMVELGIDPASMLLITFTKNAADEMEQRFYQKCGKRMNFCTIHALCYRLLCSHYGYNGDRILKQSEAWHFLAGLIKKDGISAVVIDDYVKEILNNISFVKNRDISPAMARVDKCSTELFVKAFNEYEKFKDSLGKIDFDDMLLEFRRILFSDKRLLEYCRKMYKYITVDEFQDVNQIQADIIYKIAGDNGNLFVVGDDDQSIYGFRAADPKIMLDFQRKYPNAKKINMTTNYRSGKDIVACAGRLIQNNDHRFSKKFIAKQEDNGSIYVMSAKMTHEQTLITVKEIQDLVKSGVSYSDIAVLFRTNDLSIPFTHILAKCNIPFYMTERIGSIHEDAIFQDIKSYYRLSAKKEQKGDLQRILNRPSRYLKADAFAGCSFNKGEIMKRASSLKPFCREKAVDMIWDISSLQGKDPSSFMRSLNIGMGYREWLKDYASYLGRDEGLFLEIFDSLAEEAQDFETMKEWFDYADMYDMRIRDAAKRKNKAGICLSTFHGAKGLEWDTVFIANANMDITPYKKATSNEEIEEERRAFYVAATRAKRALYISYIESDGQLPSPFIKEMGLKT